MNPQSLTRHAMPTTTTTPAGFKPDPLRCRFATEHDANQAGWRCITSPLYWQTDRELIESIHSSLSGTSPGSRPVRFVGVGDRVRISFARPAADLAGHEQSDHAGAESAEVHAPDADAIQTDAVAA